MIENTTESPDTIRTTHAMCPDCLHCVPARVDEINGEIRLVKECPEHGQSSVFLSSHPAYYRDLNQFYFSVMPKSHPQRDYIIRLTERCDLDCPICLAGANEEVLADYDLEEVKRLTKRFTKTKFDLMGCEPTVMDNLPEILRLIKASGNISALHTNGVSLADKDYARRLQEAGLDEVHLQFDGFDDEAYKIIRGEPLLENKMQTMRNLTELGIPVDLVMTVLSGVNDKEILPVLKYGSEQPNVKEIFFLGCRMLGRATGKFESCQLLPDQVIDLLDNATEGRIGREDVRRFQKLYFALLSVFGVRKCLYIQHYLILRGRKGNYQTLADVIDLKRLEPILERYRERYEAGKKSAVPRLFLEMLPVLLRPRSIPLLAEFAALTLMMAFGFNLRRVRRRSIMLGYITACDPLIYDTSVSENCGKGEISRDLGVQESGAQANVMREHRWR
ncbi:MAG: radical SAM protein [Verrucomicrobia bacterium]|jgi:7,8-dihydro-6-hydroxymethylpterin dimethyltransferase|nr:radical SAM protein [Verrucomicrobiota bacterium]